MAKAKARTKPKASSKKKPRPGGSNGNLLLVATRKGAWLFRGDAARKQCEVMNNARLAYAAQRDELIKECNTIKSRMLTAASALEGKYERKDGA